MNTFKYLKLWFLDALETFRVVLEPKPTDNERYRETAPKTDPNAPCSLCGYKIGLHIMPFTAGIKEYFVYDEAAFGRRKLHSEAIADYTKSRKT